MGRGELAAKRPPLSARVVAVISFNIMTNDNSPSLLYDRRMLAVVIPLLVAALVGGYVFYSGRSPSGGEKGEEIASSVFERITERGETFTIEYPGWWAAKRSSGIFTAVSELGAARILVREHTSGFLASGGEQIAFLGLMGEMFNDDPAYRIANFNQILVGGRSGYRAWGEWSDGAVMWDFEEYGIIVDSGLWYQVRGEFLRDAADEYRDMVGDALRSFSLPMSVK
ncbi:MAG: hypothetical protein A3D65_04020 [Candidatus Lloydbacteria bacterium RIFCSPHIGHO2_02_FULL_50_13]|uniref:PsbP C-terminal domain-containing protein n=1 Tax=Candidatus Lloydbacteria bacterium RIFCSPHIGHO2_02_FULL_50_13 TaxID=1798661 RepID=A0A1G2D9C3_9BACT|nr:MAG: hypothetical protein A3D65_04020 [Candidatus Lloydbacteria bacterium RIFCSPHIGHO2_02_FULL_50_13]